MRPVAHISRQRQRFVDPARLDDARGGCTSWCAAAERFAERPRERGGVWPMTVLAEGGRLGAWYRGDARMPPRQVQRPPLAGAKSADGSHLERPSLGRVVLSGSAGGNLVRAGSVSPPTTLRGDGVRQQDPFALASPDGLRWRRLREGADPCRPSPRAALPRPDRRRRALAGRGRDRRPAGAVGAVHPEGRGPPRVAHVDREAIRT